MTASLRGRLAPLGGVGLVAALALVSPGHATTLDPTCTTQASSASVTYSGTSLSAIATGLVNSVYSAASGGLVMTSTDTAVTLKELAFTINTSAGASEDQLRWMCSADFDRDGYADIVGVKKLKNTIGFYKNNSALSVPTTTQWADPTYTRPPVFTAPSTYIYQGTAQTVAANEKVGLTCGDLNGDGNPDFFYLRCDNSTYQASGDTYTQCTPTTAILFKGQGNGTFVSTSYSSWFSTNTTLTRGYKAAINNNVQLQVRDVDGDGAMDIMVPVVLTANQDTKWGLEVYRGSGGLSPTFSFDSTRLYSGNTGSPKCQGSTYLSTFATCESGLQSFVYQDVDGNGVKDLFVGVRGIGGESGYGSPSFGDLAAATPFALQMPTPAGTTLSPGVVLSGDFSMTGRQDLVIGMSSYSTTGTTTSGGYVYQWSNNGSAWAPYAAAGVQLSAAQTTRQKVSAGFVLNYDNDPYSTPDFVMFDADNGGSTGTPTYSMFAVRKTPARFPHNASVTAAPVALVTSDDVAITRARVKPTASLNGGALAFEVSNDDGATYFPTTACADDAAASCLTFSSTAGGTLRWRANFTSNDAQDNGPVLTAVAVTYDYVRASSHFRAAPVARDGLIYAGAFSAPGDAGRLFAITDSTGARLWEAGALLRTNTSRNLYTATSGNAVVTFSSSNASAAQATLAATSATEAGSIIDWVRSPRFGASVLQHLGAVVNSTPAVLSPPGTPYWYSLGATSATDRTAITAFVTANATRPVLVFVGAKDGIVHAFRSNPANATDPNNGKEAWGFIPNAVASRLRADYLAKTATAYPDGSATLVDAKVNGVWKTVLVSGLGNGGQAVFALDVTSTVDAATGAVTAPAPLWSFTDSNMGYSFSKPTVIRVSRAGSEKWLAVFASGKGPATSDLGDSVYAVDLATGALVWRFDLGDTGAYVSTDILATETTELDSGGTPVFDGYIDRLLFADNKGRLWKLDPASYNETSKTISALGTIDVGLGTGKSALFSTRLTPGALAADRAIAGSLAAVRDPSGHLTVYLATGGTDETLSTVQNAVYAVSGADGTVELTYGAAQGVPVGAKFYGGVVYNGTQLIFSYSTDATGGGLCAATTAEIVVLDAADFTQELVIHNAAVGSATRGSVFVRNGQIYTASSDGKIVTTAYTGAGVTGTGPVQLDANGHIAPTTFRLVGWRQL